MDLVRDGVTSRHSKRQDDPPETRWCPCCEAFVALANFSKTQRGYCRPCDSAYHAQRRGGYLYGPMIPTSSGLHRCTRCRQIKPLSEFPPPYRNVSGQLIYRSYCKPCFLPIKRIYIATHKEAAKLNGRRTRNRRRDRILEVYGTTCACCGTSDKVFLSIDHINGDGMAHRKRLGYRASGGPFYSWLVRNNFPPGFQTLCRNCNWAKHVLGSLDLCPHRANS